MYPIARRTCGMIRVDLAYLLQAMGPDDFVSAWRQAFGDEPPLKELRSIISKLSVEG